MSGFIYLASPFWHESEYTRLQRYSRALHKTSELMARGWKVFSPITYSFHIHHILDESIRHSYDFWLAQDFAFLHEADALFVLQLEGWQESRGVTAEIKFANQLSLPIRFLGEFDAVPAYHSNFNLAQAPAEGVRSREATGTSGLDRPSGPAERSGGEGG